MVDTTGIGGSRQVSAGRATILRRRTGDSEEVAMFLEMAKDMPRGRADSLARMLVPMLIAMVVVLGLVVVWTADDARVAGSLQDQVEQQAEQAGVLILDDRFRVPTSGDVQVPVQMDGRPVDGLVQVDGDEATLLVRSENGSFVPVAADD
jgi:hypothetical protein